MTLSYDDDFGKATRPSGKHEVPDSQRTERHQATTPPAGNWGEPIPRFVAWTIFGKLRVRDVFAGIGVGFTLYTFWKIAVAIAAFITVQP